MSKRLFRDPFQRVFFADGAAMAVFGGSDGAPIMVKIKIVTSLFFVILTILFPA
jgi:hypothetical protein